MSQAPNAYVLGVDHEGGHDGHDAKGVSAEVDDLVRPGGAVLVPMWLWISYRVFFTETGRSDLGLSGWAVVTLLMGILATIMVLMGKRKLPAYLVEVNEDGGE